eukprot:COSAG05_NODE_1043_length_6061_cov_10.071285_5_plen_341_part_00
MRLLGLCLLRSAQLASAGKPAGGTMIKPPLKTKHVEMHDAKQDSTDRTVDVFYPETGQASGGAKYPLLSFAHGYGGGGAVEDIAYHSLLSGVAGFGYVVVATRACDDGCHCKSKACSLDHDPAGFRQFYLQQQRAITWARGFGGAGAPAVPECFQQLNASSGVGIFGHSMGGQATVFSSSGSNASAFDVRAAVMLHAYTHVYPASSVPFLAFTGTKDTTAPPAMAEWLFNAGSGTHPRGLVNRDGATHHEVRPPLTPRPLLTLLFCAAALCVSITLSRPQPDVEDYNPLLPQFTAAWFKLYLEGRALEFGLDFDALLWGNSSSSLCGGGAGKMAACQLIR